MSNRMLRFEQLLIAEDPDALTAEMLGISVKQVKEAGIEQRIELGQQLLALDLEDVNRHCLCLAGAIPKEFNVEMTV